MRNIKKVVVIVIVFAMLTALLPQMLLCANAETLLGDCGVNLRWSLNIDTGVLTITGSGNMRDYSEDTVPWISKRFAIREIQLPEGLEKIGNYAFCCCYSLKTIQLPSSVTSIGINAFWDCDRLESVLLQEGVNQIRNQAFFDCDSLLSVTIPASVTSIGVAAFRNCRNLSGIVVSSDNPAYCSENGVLYDKEKTSLIQYPLGKGGQFRVPDGVLNIKDYSFSCCSSIRSVIIANSVTNIGDYAFFDCNSLNNIVLPDSVASIGRNAFYHCNFTSIKIPCSLEHIGADAFNGCRSLLHVTIPNSVSSIDNYAFYNCDSLESVTIPISVMNIRNGAFEGCASLKNVYYDGSRADWGNIAIYLPNDEIRAATIHCNNGEYTLKEKLLGAISEEIASWVYDDFDGDGIIEAYALTHESENAIVWYVSYSTGAIRIMNAGNAGWSSDTPLMCGKHKYMVLQQFEGGGTWYWARFYLFGVRNGQPNQPTISGNNGFFGSTEQDEYDFLSELKQEYNEPSQSGYYSCTWRGYGVADQFPYENLKYYRYDSVSMEFVDIGTNNSCQNGHTWDSFVGIIQPTCIEYGTKTRTCMVCGAIETEYIDPLGHSYINGICTRCGEKEDVHFKIKRDNYNFVNSFAAFSTEYSDDDALAEYNSGGMEGYKAYLRSLGLHYEISQELYGKLLSNTTTDRIKQKIRQERDKDWGGSCHGMTASSALVFTGKVNLSDFTGINSTCYNLPKTMMPKNNSDLRDLINYYQLSQYLDYYRINTRFYQTPSSNTISEQLENIINLAETAELTGEPFIILMSYLHDGESGGHSILGVGMDRFDNGTCVVRIVDPNDTEEYLYLSILKDPKTQEYSLFSFHRDYTTDNGYVFKNIFGIPLYYTNPYNLRGTKSSSFEEDENTTHLFFKGFAPFTLIDEDTMKKLVFDGTDFSGDIEIKALYYYFADDCPETEIEIDKGTSFKVVLPDEASVSIAADNHYYAFDTDVSSVVQVKMDSGLQIIGKDISYTLYAAVGENSDLVTVSGRSPEGVTLALDDNSVSVQDGTNTYQDVKVFIDAEIKEFGDIVVDNGEITIEQTPTPGMDYSVNGEPKLPCSGGDNCPGKAFTDMPAKGNWAHDAIDWAVVKEITSGTSATKFSPKNGCTRGQVVTFLWRAAGQPKAKSKNSPFTDIKSDAFYYDAVLWAVENGITAGTSKTKFSPNATCTRGQIVTFLWRFEGMPASISTVPQFEDVKPGAFYEKAVLWAAETSVTTGTSASKFSPNTTCNRAQVVTFLYRANDYSEQMRQFDADNYEIVYDNCTWEEAQAAAAAKGGQLVTFDSINEMRFVISLITDENRPGVYYYLGARRDENGTTYHWIDKENRLVGEALNSPDSWCNAQWKTGEPNFVWNGKQETVVLMAPFAQEGRWSWDDVKSGGPVSSSRQYAYIIEYNDSEEEQPNVNGLVGISMPTKDLHRWTEDGNHMKKLLNDAGYKVDLEFAAIDPSLQDMQIKNMIAKGAKVLVVSAIDPYVIGTALEEAKAKGITVISYDRMIWESDAVSYYVTFDNYLVGVKQGEYIEKALNLPAGGNYNIEFITGDPGDNNINFFYDGAMSVLQKYLDNGTLTCQSGQVDKMDIATEGWSTVKAQDRFETLLNTFYADKQLDAVLCSNDSTAQGVAAALASTYSNSVYPILTGQDCDIVSTINIMDGKQAMSVFKDTRDLVEKTVEMINAIMKGSEPPINDIETFDNGTGIIPSYLCAPKVCTKDTIQEILIDSGYYTEEDLQH